MITKATIKYIQSLQHKKFRDELNVFFAEGPKVVLELLSHTAFECTAIYCTKNFVEIITETPANKHFSKIIVIEEFELAKISALSVPNNVLAVFQKRATDINMSFANSLTILLDDIQDPGNLGTIIRIADWFGIKNICCSKATVDCYNPKVVQSTMASLARVNIVYDDLMKIVEENKDIKKYAAVLDGINVKQLGKIAEGMLIIGNESKGISEPILEKVEVRITIARIGEAESLNAAVATGIILQSIT
jgi:RNA methyltransferase, TrmH family